MRQCLIYLFLYILISCQVSVDNKVYNSGIHIIPEPLQLEVLQGAFSVNNSTTIFVDDDNWQAAADILKNKLENMQVRLDLKGVNYYIPVPEGELTTNKVFTGDSVVLEFKNICSLLKKLVLRESCTLKVGTKTTGGRLGPIRTVAVEKQKAISALKSKCSERIYLKLANGLFKNEEDYAKAEFSKDIIISFFHYITKDKFDLKTSGLAVYSSEIEVPETGIYTFKSNVNKLWIAVSD